MQRRTRRAPLGVFILALGLFACARCPARKDGTDAGEPDGATGPADGGNAFLSCGCFPPTTLCDPSIGRCVECFTDEDCPASAPRCQENACVACLSSSDCASDMVCLTVEGPYLFVC